MNDALEQQRWIARRLSEFHNEAGVALAAWTGRVEAIGGRREQLQQRLARWRSDEASYAAKKSKVQARLERVQALLRRPALHIASIKSLSEDRAALEAANAVIDERLALAGEEATRLEGEIAALGEQTIDLPNVLIKLWSGADSDGEFDEDGDGDE